MLRIGSEKYRAPGSLGQRFRDTECHERVTISLRVPRLYRNLAWCAPRRLCIRNEFVVKSGGIRRQRRQSPLGRCVKRALEQSIDQFGDTGPVVVL